MSFRAVGTVSDGTVPFISSCNPSKPFLLYAQISVNQAYLQTLVDTGASNTCINRRVLRRLSNIQFVDRSPQTLTLADGIIPLQVFGRVELVMNIEDRSLHFHALVTENLCTDLVLGLDFMIAFRATIDIDQQKLFLKTSTQSFSLHVDDKLRRPLVAVHSHKGITIPPFSISKIPVISPISTMTGYFILSQNLKANRYLKCGQETMQLIHHQSELQVINQSNKKQHIPQNFCLGYILHSSTADQRSCNQSIIDYSRREFQQKLSLGASEQIECITPKLSMKDHHTMSDNRESGRSLILSAIPPASTFHLQHTIDTLVRHLTNADIKNRVSKLLTSYSHLFDNSHHNISDIVIENVFNTVSHSPPASRPHRNPHTYAETQRLIDEFLEAGLIQESNSPYAAPAFIVPRKDNRPGRLVVDYRALNKITTPDASPLPHSEDLLQELGKGYKFFSKLDLKSGYHQFRIPVEDRQKTAFVVSQGHYEFLVLSMGPQNAPVAFQKTMSRILKSCREFCQVFLDDILIFSKTFSEHIDHLSAIFRTLSAAKLVLNATKCELVVQQVVVLGHLVSETDIKPTQDAVRAILELAEPRTLKQANKFLGGLAYYRKFVPDFARIAAPIHQVTNLTRNRRHFFKWGPEQSKAFHELRILLTTKPLFLHFPIPDFPLHLATDASNNATGGVLYQEIEGNRHTLFYHSKILSAVEQKYSVPEKEALAIFHCLQRMRTLILGRTVFIHTDHCPICNMLQKPVNNRRIERVANLIQEYRIAGIKHISGSKNCLADYLSRPFDDPLFDIQYGVESKEPQPPSLMTIGVMKLRPRKPQIVTEESHSPLMTVTPSPNTFNSDDLYTGQANDRRIQQIIKQLSKNKHSPLSRSFILKDGILHKIKSSHTNDEKFIHVPWLPSNMVSSFLTAMHNDPYQGGHFSVNKMLSKIKTRFWWPRMYQHLRHYVNSCEQCQAFNISRQKPPGFLRPILPDSTPFSMIGMDFCGPFPESPQGNKYILVISDLFTHYTIAVPLPKNTAELTALTLFRRVFCIFGVCKTLLTDQGTHFNNQLMAALQHLIGYNHIFSVAYHPQTNGVVERFNASLVVQLSKLQQTHHNNWDEYIEPVIFAYNTAQHKSSKYSPFELLFGRPPQLPIDPKQSSFSFRTPNDHFQHLQRILTTFHGHARANILSQQRYNKQRYDIHRTDPRYDVGARVFTKIRTSRGKLDPRYLVDNQIIVKATHPTYIVKHIPTGVKRKYHVSDLRPVSLLSLDD